MNQFCSKKALFVANTGRFYNFEKNNIELLQNKGIEVHFAANFKLTVLDDIHPQGVVLHQLDCTRSPFTKANLHAYKTLKTLIESERFDIIHCHTPVGGVLTRLAARRCRRLGTRVIYSAHGFHFYKGAPLKYWALFYPVEWLCSWMTDVLITINKEDYMRAYNHFHAKKTCYIPGVGINTKQLKKKSFDIYRKKQSLGVGPNDIMLLSVGELNHNKNHQVLIKALANIRNTHIKCLIAGRGELKNELQYLICKYHVEKNVFILGFRKDLAEIYQCADVFLFPSFREGLSAALMEAMANNLPVVCSDIRGNNDLIDNHLGGYRVSPTNEKQWSQAIQSLINEKKLRVKYGEYNHQKIVTSFSRSVVQVLIDKIYNEQLYGKDKK